MTGRIKRAPKLYLEKLRGENSRWSRWGGYGLLARTQPKQGEWGAVTLLMARMIRREISKMARPTKRADGQFLGSLCGLSGVRRSLPSLLKFGSSRQPPSNPPIEPRNPRMLFELARARIELATQGFSVLCSTD